MAYNPNCNVIYKRVNVRKRYLCSAVSEAVTLTSLSMRKWDGL